MKQNARTRVVISVDEVVRNIHAYARSVAEHPGLARRIKQHAAWYATRDKAGNWIFGPSKFVGYVDANPRSYLASYSRKDGKETEPALRAWFRQVDPETVLGQELRDAFVQFADRHAKTPNANWRVSVTEEELVARGAALRTTKAHLGDRIAFDPEICGGRPRIAGTRVRVSDIVQALAEGASAQEILEDFPYLSAADISAALAYAAQAVDHRVLKAA